LLVDIGIQKGDDILVNGKSNFNPRNERVKECLKFKEFLVSARPNPKNVIEKM